MRPSRLFAPRPVLASLALAALLPLAACDTESPVPSGLVTLRKDQGVDFFSGVVQIPGDFDNSDLIARTSGSGLSLTTGGPSPVETRPINWFLGAGGVEQRFGSLAEVPDTRPDAGMTGSNTSVREGEGFVTKSARGHWTRGWIQATDGTSVTIAFELLGD
jgi:hypothetical protein